MPVEGFRSPYDKQAGRLHHLGRMIDKIRLMQAGRLPEEYHPNYGLSFGLDGQMCGFLGVEFKDLEARIAQGGTDDEIAEWIFTRGLRPNRQQAVVWNEYIRKLGWRDRGAAVLAKVKAESGFGDRHDIVTIFDGIALREGHPLAPPPEPLSPEIEAALRARSAPPPASSS